jgi:hypothetical protein
MPTEDELHGAVGGTSPVPPAEPPIEIEVPALPESGAEPDAKREAMPLSWLLFLDKAKDQEIKERFSREAASILDERGLGKYCVLALFEPKNSIDTTDLDRIFSALSELNPDRSKDVLLLLLSRGGSIEPAYQISKLCKLFSNRRFVAVVPRNAKSAATLIALGADKIHMGLLGQLGPIDPQLDGLPALGVSQALRTIASVAEAYPGSASMFAQYLKTVLTVEQIGYCDRISQSAVQYAVRLLSTKPDLQRDAEEIARELVHEYKDHEFVIDVQEARARLGENWVKTDTVELTAAEEIYSLFESVNFVLGFKQSKYMLIMGGVTMPNSIMLIREKKRR